MKPIALLMFCLPLAAQQPFAEGLLRAYTQYQLNLEEAVAKVAPEMLDYRPTPDVKSFREHAAHVLDGNFSMCAQIKGEANPNKGSLEDAKLGKPALLKAAFEAGVYCTAALKGMTDAQGGEAVALSNGNSRTKAYTAVHLVEHFGLHYGNLITYMRLKGVTPPETERRRRATPAAK
jgi:uncharacterized damage-inducible protein DinB